jgi:putative DNA primase/helicase
MKADANIKDLAPDRVDVLSEVHIADCFAREYGNELRYVAKWGQWLRYDGKRWVEEPTLMAFDLARRLCRELIEEMGSKPSETKGILSAKTVAAVERLARADRRIAAVFDQWDTDPFLLNTPDGTVDLKTGDLKPHRLEDYVTKMTAVAPGGECPLWYKFLDRFTASDEKLQSFLQRACGYCLTGDTREEALFFFFGLGANGKGVFFHTIAGILNDYHCAASMETFTFSVGERHTTELARLCGARLVTAAETEEGKRWNESRIKTLTGRDKIAARFMRQDDFEFVPQFKLLISGNHRPGLRTVDEAIKRRMNLVNCAVTIPEDERDPELAEKLKAELSGILAWMIEGCMEWQKVGLKAPAAVVNATNNYIAGEDAFAAWLADCCIEGVDMADTSAALWSSWKEYSKNAEEFVGNRRRFSQKLEDLGFERCKIREQRGHRGLALKDPGDRVKEEQRGRDSNPL